MQNLDLSAIRQRFSRLQIERHETLSHLLAQLRRADDPVETTSQVIDILHKIAGVSGSLGMPDLGDAARAAEIVGLHALKHVDKFDLFEGALEAFLIVSEEQCKEDLQHVG